MDHTPDNCPLGAEIKTALSDTSKELRKTQICINKFHVHFEEQYKPFLDQLISERDYWRDIKKDAVKGTVKASVWSVIVGTLALIGLGALHYVKEVLGIKQ